MKTIPNDMTVFVQRLPQSSKAFFQNAWLWIKRLLHRPLFWLTLLLIPVCAIWMQHAESAEDAALNIALYTDMTTADDLSKNLVSELVSLSNKTLRFYSCPSKDQLLDDLSAQKTVSGYVIPANLSDALSEYAVSKKPFITVFRNPEEFSSMILDEIVLGKIYRTHAYRILEDFIREKDKNTDTNLLKDLFQGYLREDLLFDFEYTTKDAKAKSLDEPDSYLLLPLRGMISVMILLACMAGTALWYEDKANGFLFVAKKRNRRYSSFFSLFLPSFFAGTAGILTLQASGISNGFPAECVSMGVYLFACMGLVSFLRSLLPDKALFLSAIPVLVIGSLVLCPIFIDLSIAMPVVKMLRRFFPTDFYLASDFGKGILYGGTCFLLGQVCTLKFEPHYLRSP